MTPQHTTSRLVRIEELAAGAEESVLSEARELLLEYGQFVTTVAHAPCCWFSTVQNEAAGLPASFREQGGGSLMARVNGEPVGFVAWRDMPPQVAPEAWELKRLWVRPAGRGLGLGRVLTLEVLDRAVAAGRTAVYLDTAPASMGMAHRLYIELGFTPCTSYNDNPVEGLAYLVKKL
jgi:putative acetyltransferase